MFLSIFWPLIAMLIVFLIVHVNMLLPGNQLGISPWILWLRIPIQFILIYWAYINLSQVNGLIKRQTF